VVILYCVYKSILTTMSWKMINLLSNLVGKHCIVSQVEQQQQQQQQGGGGR
jgi:hypothetical protein